MLNPYQNVKTLKNESEQYIKLLNSKKNLPQNNDIICITKLILFYKKFFSNEQNPHYKNFMIYDMLMIMHSLTQNSVINFYHFYRSFIENFIRSMLDLQDSDSTGVNNLFKEFRNKFDKSDEHKELIDYIWGEYSKSCDFVHSNIKADIAVYTYYIDIIETDEMNSDKLKKLIGKIFTLFRKCTKFIILIYPNKIADVFYRNDQELKYMVGGLLFEEFKKSFKYWQKY